MGPFIQSGWRGVCALASSCLLVSSLCAAPPGQPQPLTPVPGLLRFEGALQTTYCALILPPTHRTSAGAGVGAAGSSVGALMELGVGWILLVTSQLPLGSTLPSFAISRRGVLDDSSNTRLHALLHNVDIPGDS